MSEDLQKTEAKLQNRWLVVIAAVVLELALGAIYAWSVYNTSFYAAGLTDTQASLPYSISLASFAVTTVVAGRLKEKIGPRILIILSAIFLGGGYIMAGLLPLSVWSLVVFIGIIGGIGIGLSYAIPISTGVAWFPDKKGLVTGLGMAGFGAGSLIWQYLFSGIFEGRVNPLSKAFVTFGICYAVFIGFSYFFLYEPPQGYKVEGYVPPEALPENEGKVKVNLDSKQMLKTPQFYMIFISYMLGVGAGLMYIGIAKSWPASYLTDVVNKDADTVQTVTLLASAFIYPLFNGLGRIVWGILAEKLSWRTALIIMNGVQAIFFFFLMLLAKSYFGLVILTAVVAFNYGGNFSLFPQATRETFGPKYISQNYGWVFLSYGFGGILIPMVGAVLREGGNQNITFLISAIGLTLTVGLMLLYKKPKEE